MNRAASSMALILFVALASMAPAFKTSDQKLNTESDSGRPRSLLFYLIDTCRGDRMPFDGYERVTAPFLKSIAKKSVVFEACFTQAPWTKPSMASMLTSKYPSTTGVFKMDQRLPDEQRTWPELLQENGLYTAGFSANIVMGNLLSNFAQGFDHFVESMYINRGDPIRFASGSAKKLNRRIFKWLDRTDHWPMLLYVHSVDPHEEYEPEPHYLEKFADPDRHPKYREEWQKLLKSRPPIPGLYVTQDNFDRTDIDSASFMSHGSNLYDADILANDDQMRLLWDRMQEEGWGEDFIFVFTSDHGEEFFEHGGTSHGYSLYEEMIRVPLMIYAPGLLPEGMKIKKPVRSIDIFPTLCELLNLEIPEGLAGESLVPLINGEETDVDRVVFSEHREDPTVRLMGQGSGELVSVRTGDWKLIVNQKSSQLIEKPRLELYNLRLDPAEKNNVADGQPDLVAELELKVATFVGDHRQGETLEDWISEDAEVLAQLEALGYIDGSKEKAASKVPDLWESVWSRDNEKVLLALEGGADPNEMNQQLFIRPLSMAAMRGDLEMSKTLLEWKAEVDGRGRDGSTALSGAAFFGRVDVLKLLLENGANPSAINNAGESVIDATRVDWAITEGVSGLLKISLERETLEAGRTKCAELLEARND